MQKPQSGGSYRLNEDGSLELIRLPTQPAESQPQQSEPVPDAEPQLDNEDVDDGAAI